MGEEITKMRRLRSNIKTHEHQSSSSSHASDDTRPGVKKDLSSIFSLDKSTSHSNYSLSSAITTFREDFDDLKCKMKIFGESLNLCHCIASDFKNKVKNMERRLENLEKRQKLNRTESNYSAIIQKNKHLSSKMRDDAKKLIQCKTEAEMTEVAARICRNYLHGTWKTVNPADLTVRKITGGLSNFLYFAQLPQDFPDTGGSLIRTPSFIALDEPKKVLLRIYGQVHGERAMDAIVTESVIFTLLSERRIGPKLHGVFAGGRIEEFIEGRPLLTKEMSDPVLSSKIAENVAAIHSMDIPLSKEPTWLWKTMEKWLKTVKEERLNTDPTKTKMKEEEKSLIKRLQSVDFDKEVEWLKTFLSNVKSPVVFCHNDMQEGNILLLDERGEVEVVPLPSGISMDHLEDKGIQHDPNYEEYDDIHGLRVISEQYMSTQTHKLVLIDFEYCAYNHRGFEIANHFQEWVFDYTNPEYPHYFERYEDYPTEAQKEHFVTEYLNFYNHLTNESTPTQDDINQLLSEVEAFVLASHLFWCLWSMVNASKSQIPFGYWEYAWTRLETFLRLKGEIISKGKAAKKLKTT